MHQTHETERRSAERRRLIERSLAGEHLVIVRVEKVYGVERIYPVSPTAQAIARLAGTKTLTPDMIRIARDELGLTIAEDPTPRLQVQP